MTFEELNKLMNPEILKIIKQNENESPDSYVLKNTKNKELPIRAIAEQISCRKKAKKKLPSFNNSDFLYNPVSLEQCSGDAAAKFKSGLLKGTRILDMTGGLGIDDLYFSKNFNELIYCEMDKTIFRMTEYNFKNLKIDNVKFINNDSAVELDKFADNYFDWIYLDPARRDGNKRSVDLNYCSPNVIELQQKLLTKSKNVCIKVAPAYDITEAIRTFQNLKNVFVVSVDGECKEGLLFLERKYEGDTGIKAVILNSVSDTIQQIESIYQSEIKNEVISSTLKYFFEPDAAIIKAGLTKKLAKDVGLNFLNLNVDYLVGNCEIMQFPGRQFELLAQSSFKPPLLKSYLKQNKIKKANFSKRDFPHSVDDLRKKFKIADGGEDYFFFTKNSENKLIYIHAKKIGNKAK